MCRLRPRRWRRRRVAAPRQRRAASRRLGVTPELGVMDLGFISNAVALRDDRLLPARPWFLIELDSPSYGAGRQVAPSTVANYDLLASLARAHFPRAAWAGHGN